MSTKDNCWDYYDSGQKEYSSGESIIGSNKVTQPLAYGCTMKWLVFVLYRFKETSLSSDGSCLSHCKIE